MARIPSFRSKDAEIEDKASLEKEEKELSSMRTKRKLFGGKDHHGYMRAGVTDQELSEKEGLIERKKADEAMFERDKDNPDNASLNARHKEHR